MKKYLSVLFIGVAMGVWCFQMIPGFLLVLVVFVIWPLIYDFIKEEDHEID